MLEKYLEKKYYSNYKKIIRDNNGEIFDTINLKNGEFFEIEFENEFEQQMIITFTLNGMFIALELGEKNRKNRMSILHRNYNGEIYIFKKNLLNLNNRDIDYYLDYYNEHIIIDNKYAHKLLKEIKFKLESMLLTEINNKKMVELCNCKLENIITNKDSILKQYSSELPILPPNVRPDIDPQYMIVQICVGCRVMNMRGRACAFCNAYSNYEELSTVGLEQHLGKLLKYSGEQIKFINKVFLSDGDALGTLNIEAYISKIKEYFPKVSIFEAFISTLTILESSEEKLEKLIKSGVKKVYWGLESADDNVLKFLDKPQNNQSIIKAREKLERVGINYDLIIMCGVGLLDKENRKEDEIYKNPHIQLSSQFINESNCDFVYISKLQIIPQTKLYENFISKKIFPYNINEMDIEYRTLIKNINKNVKGAYGNQFIVERIKE